MARLDAPVALDQPFRMLLPFRKCCLPSLVLLAAGLLNAFGAGPAGGERLLLDSGWKFHLGNEWGQAQNLAKAGSGSGPASPWFSDASWRTVNLPHDWAIELPFDPSADGSHGFKALGHGFPSNSVAWYRRTFQLAPGDAGKRVWLEFDGVFRDCTVFLNGWFVGHHESGYSSFRYDVTDIVNRDGKNTLAVKVDASEVEGWFYEGAGIYRHVWLAKTASIAVAPDGVFVYSHFRNNVPEGAAEIHVQADLENATTNSAIPQVKWQIIGPDGAVAANAKSEAARLAPGVRGMVVQHVRLAHPQLWSPESPKLYRLITSVETGGAVVDRVETEFGIKTVAFDPAKGFLLNGQPYELKGTCNHQDHAGVGAALPDALQSFRVAKLKEMGANAYRTSHNPPTPELLDACDHLGMLVMDENRLLGSDSMHLRQVAGLVQRDRNHASVAIWSIANEEFTVQATPAGARVAQTVQDLFRQLDPTRPITYPAPEDNDFYGINSVIQVRGWNYHIGKDMEDYHAAHPSQPNVGTEQGSTVSTRGIYANDPQRGYVSAYDDNAPTWAHTAETWWSYFAPRPWLSGGFVWTGFDYRGEPTPYGWPCVNSHFGILDTCGFPKDNFWYYQSWWTDKPVLHLLPHWNWPGREGQDIDVRALSNCEEVELFLNGESLGRQPMKRNSELKWKVKYAPGTLSAKGYNHGTLVAETKVETTGAPASVQLEPDRTAVNADGADVSVIAVSVRDAQGRLVPVAANNVRFAIEGPGHILGVGNGDPSCHEPDVFVPASTAHSRAITGWRWHRIQDGYASWIAETAAQFDDSSWAPEDAPLGDNPPGREIHRAYRAHFTVTDQDLASPAVELCFGTIDGDSRIFVNGEKLGESQDSAAPVVDVRSHLHAGDNIVAVVDSNWNPAAGMSKGVSLRFQDPPVQPVWKRSVFNGLAEIIVQSEKQPGDLKLTATADGLQSGSVIIHAQPATPLPAVP